MKETNKTAARKKISEAYSVKPVVDQLIKAVLYCSTKKGIFIINDIPPALKSNSDLSVLALVVGNLIKEAICFSENDCLRISSKETGEIVISSKKNHLSLNRSFMVSVDSLQVIAERLGNRVAISGSFTNGMEIFVRFNKNAA